MSEDFDVEFSTWYTKINGYEVEITEDGYFYFEETKIFGVEFSLNEISELVRKAKMFRDRRIAYKAKQQA